MQRIYVNNNLADAQNIPPAPAQPAKQPDNTPPVFRRISPVKVFILMFFTMGVYIAFWCYKQWATLKKNTPAYSKIMPFWRAVFSLIFIFPLTEILVNKYKKSAALYIIPLVLIFIQILFKIMPVLLFVIFFMLVQAVLLTVMQVIINGTGGVSKKEGFLVISDILALIFTFIVLYFSFAAEFKTPPPLKTVPQASRQYLEGGISVEFPYTLTLEPEITDPAFKEIIAEHQVYSYDSDVTGLAFSLRHSTFYGEPDIETMFNSIMEHFPFSKSDYEIMPVNIDNVDCERRDFTLKGLSTRNKVMVCVDGNDLWTIAATHRVENSRDAVSDAVFDSIEIY
ncbi:hypothetical protein AAIR98_001253 [Elusimicrobium simillimum]|uniref:hypothetical protein n=1 Tax=Elusimicrobium simillimum TaxID=3143438 RepID=UPI003C6F9FDA